MFPAHWNGMHVEPVDPRSRAFRAGRAGLSLRDRGRSERTPLLRRRQRTGARDLGGLRPRYPFRARPGMSPMRSSTAGCSRFEGFERAIRSEVPPYQVAVDRGALRRRPGFPPALCARRSRPSTPPRPATPPGSTPTRCDGLAAAETLTAAEIELGATADKAALSRLSTGRRHRLHLWRPCDQRAGGGARRARAAARPLRGRRNHRPFLSVPRPTPCRCCARWCLGKLPDGKRSTSSPGR